jgi:Domain of unknown function (DUF4251)
VLPPVFKISFSLTLALIVFSHTAVLSQTPPPQTSKAAAMKSLVESGAYIFRAQSVMPLSGRVRQLTTDDYTLKITADKITSDLPYFGQAYTAPMDPTKTGIQFTSKDFTYTLTPRKKGGWDVLIKPKDYKDVQQMSMSISADGYASLQVISANRQAISFNGVITGK